MCDSSCSQELNHSSPCPASTLYCLLICHYISIWDGWGKQTKKMWLKVSKRPEIKWKSKRKSASTSLNKPKQNKWYFFFSLSLFSHLSTDCICLPLWYLQCLSAMYSLYHMHIVRLFSELTLRIYSQIGYSINYFSSLAVCMPVQNLG